MATTADHLMESIKRHGLTEQQVMAKLRGYGDPEVHWSRLCDERRATFGLALAVLDLIVEKRRPTVPPKGN